MVLRTLPHHCVRHSLCLHLISHLHPHPDPHIHAPFQYLHPFPPHFPRPFPLSHSLLTPLLPQPASLSLLLPPMTYPSPPQATRLLPPHTIDDTLASIPATSRFSSPGPTHSHKPQSRRMVGK